MSGLDGSDLAVSQHMVVVTVQYRLGILGFLKNDALKVSGNFGLKDVAMALSGPLSLFSKAPLLIIAPQPISTKRSSTSAAIPPPSPSPAKVPAARWSNPYS